MGLFSFIGKGVDILTGGADLGLGSVIGGAIDASQSSGSQAGAAQQGVSQAGSTLAQYTSPYIQAGLSGVNQLLLGSTPGGQFNKTFTLGDMQNAPAYQFSLNEGENAIKNNAAALGGLASTNTGRDLVKFAEGTASQYENQAFNQWLQNQQFNRGTSEFLAQLGGTTAMSVAPQLANLNLASAGINVGNLQNQNNAINNASNQLFSNPNFTNWLSGQGSSTVTPTGGDPNNFTSTVDTGNLVFSDARLKEDIRPVGKTFKGQTVYTYKMKDGGPTQMGVMAQESNPSAVSRHDSGYLMVDYAKV